VRQPAGWRPGEVAFGADYTPIPVGQLDLHTLTQHASADADAPAGDNAMVESAPG